MSTAPPGRKSRPGRASSETAFQDTAAANLKSTSSIAPAIVSEPRRHDYALLVVAARADGVLISQLFVNLPAAERKVTRTRDRGLFASITLVRLEPVLDASPADLTLVGAS